MVARCARSLLFVLAFAAAAHASPWALRVDGGRTDYSHHTISSYSLGRSELSLDGGNVLSLAAEYRPTPRLGFELSASSVDLDARWRVIQVRPSPQNPSVPQDVVVASDSGSFSLRPIAVTFLFHPLRTGRFDFYVGPQAGRVAFHAGVNGPPHRDPEWAFGGKAGFEMELGGSPWSAGLVYRFLETQHEGLERDQYTGIGIHQISATLSYRLR
jgi:hypothetical protein